MSVRLRKKRRGPTADLYSRYDVVREALEVLGFQVPEVPEGTLLPDTTASSLLWTDLSVSVQRIKGFENWQRVNHFPSMHLLSQKMYLCQTLRRMHNVLPAMYEFYPKTWSLRSDSTALRTHCHTAKFRTYIVKPNGGCQGKGIILTRDPLNADLDEGTDYVVQEYIKSPLLIEGKKFDMRVYVLITNIRLPSVFVYTEGLVRICAETYAKPKARNLRNACIHLTNYAINKHSERFEPTATTEKDDTGDHGNKRDFRFLNGWLTENGHDPSILWGRVDDIVAKCILSAQPEVEQVYNTCFPHHNNGFSCFEVLGLDILVDTKLRPWLIEVNHSPNLTCDAAIDHRVKLSMLQDTMRIVNVRSDDKQSARDREKAVSLVDPAIKAENVAMWNTDKLTQEDASVGGFRRVLPSKQPELAAMYEAVQRAAMEARMAGLMPRRRISTSTGPRVQQEAAASNVKK